MNTKPYQYCLLWVDIDAMEPKITMSKIVTQGHSFIPLLSIRSKAFPIC